MSSNKNAKQKLIELYGAEDFIDKLHLREEKDKHYTGKGQMQKMQQLTYHHILEKRKGGKATVENGALLSEENHQWFNKQNIQRQVEMNKAFQQYKIAVGVIKNGKVEQVQEIETDMTNYITIPLKENRETKKQRRAREKIELRKELEEYDRF